MDWRDEGVLLAVRRHGETSSIIEVFTLGHGRHAGIVHGGASRRLAPLLQPGAQLDVTWRARLDEHLGSYAVEPLRSRAALMSDRLALAGLNSICALLTFLLPEREAHGALYGATIGLLDRIGAGEGWAVDYLRWELGLLEEMGYGLDLSSCALTGSRDDLAYVSPKSGRAVAREAAGEWVDRLLPLPACLLGQGPAGAGDIADGLRLTGYFLEHRIAPELGSRPLPEARRRLVTLLSRTV
ncbi:DNA replication and repair protein RecO [Defluviimonas denitrificans]|jgi:DNA repair protein RecO (recombination protein O)|uniref:DNA repair protein RecO n=1 Tax=Albidovulum denitrificans TaxID=404881 RepID=A0A2S8S4U6_9RHOB|nr:DNA repair protein RecO [Defluviimonas denitrificans]PQV55831.1 DNA replication and repair protein RecO [Defluviimonas denitrificans]